MEIYTVLDTFSSLEQNDILKLKEEMYWGWVFSPGLPGSEAETAQCKGPPERKTVYFVVTRSQREGRSWRGRHALPRRGSSWRLHQTTFSSKLITGLVSWWARRPSDPITFPEPRFWILETLGEHSRSKSSHRPHLWVRRYNIVRSQFFPDSSAQSVQSQSKSQKGFCNGNWQDDENIHMEIDQA